MANKTAAGERNWKLFPGVGFAPESGHLPDQRPAMHYVVLMQSMFSGTEVYGPFLTEAAAYEWIRTAGEDELYGRFDRCTVPGMSFHVAWMMLPYTRGE